MTAATAHTPGSINQGCCTNLVESGSAELSCMKQTCRASSTEHIDSASVGQQSTCASISQVQHSGCLLCHGLPAHGLLEHHVSYCLGPCLLYWLQRCAAAVAADAGVHMSATRRNWVKWCTGLEQLPAVAQQQGHRHALKGICVPEV
jgi:hypothetical protein